MEAATGAAALSEVACQLAEDGDFAAAIETFQAVLAQQPADPAVILEQMSQCYSETGQHQEAHEAACRACYLAPQVCSM